MKTRFVTAALVLLCVCLPVVAQDKVLTIDDIFDPVKKVNFAGTLPNIRWMKDGKHYILTNEASNRSVPRLQKVRLAEKTCP